MANGKKSFIAYCDWYNLIEDLDNEETGIITKWLFQYVNDENPSFPSEKHLSIICKVMKSQLKEDLVKWEEIKEKRIESGRLGGLAKASKSKQVLANDSNGKQNLANLPVYDNVDVNVNVNDNVYKEETILTNSKEEKQIESLTQIQNYIQEIETKLGRVLTIYENEKVKRWFENYSLKDILYELDSNKDKARPIDYIDKALMNAKNGVYYPKNKIEDSVIETDKKIEYPEHIDSWYQAYKIFYDENAPLELKQEAKEYLKRST